jgi:hypothetical protein
MASARKTKARLTKNALVKLRAKNKDLVQEQEQGLSLTEEQAQSLGDELVKSTIQGFEKELSKSSPALQNIAMRFSDMIKEFFVGFKEGVNAELKQFVKDSGKVVSNSVSTVEKAVTTNLEALKQQTDIPTPPAVPTFAPTEKAPVVPGRSESDLLASILARRDADKSIVAKSTGSNIKNYLTEVALGSIGMPEKGREIVEKRQQKETFIKTEKVLRQEQFKGMSEKEIRKQLERDFKTIKESTEKLKEIETQIQSYKEMGYSEKQIEKLGVGAEKPELLRKISAADVSRLPLMKEKDSTKEPVKYTEEEKQEEIQRQEVQAKENEKQTALLAEIATLLRQGSGGAPASPTEGSSFSLPSIPLPGKGLLATAAGALASGAKKIARGARSALGLAAKNPLASKLLGGAAAVGMGAYTAYSGYQDADRQGEEKRAAIDEALKNGEITPDEALKQKEQIDAETTENKGGAVGKGTGMAVGALAGVKAGALLGSFVGPIGTVVGGLAGGAIGAISGSSVGQNIGGFIGKGVAGAKNLFGMGRPTVETTGASQEPQALALQGVAGAEPKVVIGGALGKSVSDEPKSLFERGVAGAKNLFSGFDTKSFTAKDVSGKLASAPPDGNGIAAAAAMGKNIVVQAPAPVVVPQGGGSQIVLQPFTTNIRNKEPSISDYLRTRY